MNATEARALIERFTAHTDVPTLTPAEVGDLLGLARAERPWRPDTAYGIGVSVIPTNPDGVRWVSTVAGTTGSVEPTWADGVTDGGVVWTDGGDITYDVYGAAAIGWEWKAARVAGKFDHTRGDMSFSRAQMFAHCKAQADYYRGRSSGIALANANATAGTGRPGIGVASAAPSGHLRRVDMRRIDHDPDD